jgi:hypothetical protein
MTIKRPDRYWTTTKGMSGFFAVRIWFNPDMGGFEEPEDTGIGRYRTLEEAVHEATEQAQAEGIPYISSVRVNKSS